MRWVDLQEWGLERMDQLAVRLGRPRLAAHLEVGMRGERAALLDLRRRGYTVVARRWTSAKARGDVDLIAWHGNRLCFVEVKTRTLRTMTPAEAAVDEDKRRMLRQLARLYVATFPEPERRTIAVRFDVVSVYEAAGGHELQILEDAFGWR